jgi:sporulation protein YlmC with PRC-barrel domain
MLLAGAAALSLGVANAALAQQQGGQGQTSQAQPGMVPSQQPGSPEPAVVGQLRTAQQALRQSQGQLSGDQQPNFAQARIAVDAGLDVIGRVPPQVQGQDAWRNARRELNEAQQALEGPRPNQQQVATQLREAADALGTLARQVGGSDQRTGATTQAPPPTQSGGAQPQQAATSPATGVSLQSVQNLVGRNVVGSNGREAGEIRNLLIDNAGRVRAAVIEWGGFLGLGERQAMVPIERIRLGQGEADHAQLTMTREELEALPRYDRDRIAEYGRERGWGEGLRLYR